MGGWADGLKGQISSKKFHRSSNEDYIEQFLIRWAPRLGRPPLPHIFKSCHFNKTDNKKQRYKGNKLEMLKSRCPRTTKSIHI